jgi:predicted Zn-dependent protease
VQVTAFLTVLLTPWFLQEEGNALAEAEEFQRALRVWEQALALTPKRAALHESVAQALLELGRDWEAVQAAERAVDSDSGFVEGHVTLARAQLNLGEAGSIPLLPTRNCFLGGHMPDCGA